MVGCFKFFERPDGKPSGQDERVLDLELIWVPLAEPLTLEGAEGESYGVLTLPFAPRTNTVITTPLGQGDKDLTITLLPWADIAARRTSKKWKSISCLSARAGQKTHHSMNLREALTGAS